MDELSRPMSGFPDRSTRVASSRLGLGLIWLLIAVSSIVKFEPAPYDVLALGLVVGLFVLGLRVPARLAAPVGLLGCYLLGNMLAALSAPDPVETVGTVGIRIYLALTWLLLACAIYEDPRRVLAVIWHGYVIAATLAALVGILGYFNLISFGGDVSSIRWGRATGPFKDANVLGPFLVPAIIYLVARLESLSGFKVLVTAALFALLTLANFLAFSRGAWGTLVMAFVIYLCLRLGTSRSGSHQRRLVLIGAALAGLATLLVIGAISSGHIGERFYQRASLLQDYDVGRGGRFGVQSEVLEDSLTDPVGVGPGRSQGLFGRVPHSLYLNALVEAGWLGALGMWGFLALSLWRGFLFSLRESQVQGMYLIAFASLAGTLAESFVIGSTHWRHLYLLLAMIWGPALAYEDARRRAAPAGLTARDPMHRSRT